MSRLRRGGTALLLPMLLLAGPASAQDFLPLSDVASKSPTGRVLFFPLAERFEAASPYALLLAPGRRITWTPESAELPAASVAATSVRAIGTPPARAEEARYLVPVLDGAGAALTFAPLRLDGSRLVPFEGEPKPGLDVVPVLSGPRLDATPSETPLERVLDAPVELDADVLEDVVPSVLVRKATPSRVVFGVQVGAAYVPLVDEAGLAVAAKHEDRAGLAVAVADDFVPPSTTAPPRSPSPEDDSGGEVPWAVVGAVSGGVVLAVGLVLARRRRRR